MENKLYKKELYRKVRRAILEQKESFCIIDLYYMLEDITDDRDLILDCFEDLYRAGLFAYKEVKENVWAFVAS